MMGIVPVPVPMRYTLVALSSHTEGGVSRMNRAIHVHVHVHVAWTERGYGGQRSGWIGRTIRYVHTLASALHSGSVCHCG